MTLENKERISLLLCNYCCKGWKILMASLFVQTVFTVFFDFGPAFETHNLLCVKLSGLNRWLSCVYDIMSGSVKRSTPLKFVSDFKMLDSLSRHDRILPMNSMRFRVYSHLQVLLDCASMPSLMVDSAFRLKLCFDPLVLVLLVLTLPFLSSQWCETQEARGRQWMSKWKSEITFSCLFFSLSTAVFEVI